MASTEGNTMQSDSSSTPTLRAPTQTLQPVSTTPSTNIITELTSTTPCHNLTASMSNISTNDSAPSSPRSDITVTPEMISSLKNDDSNEIIMSGKGIKALQMCNGIFETREEKATFEARTAAQVQYTTTGNVLQRLEEQHRIFKQLLWVMEDTVARFYDRILLSESELNKEKGKNIELQEKLAGERRENRALQDENRALREALMVATIEKDKQGANTDEGQNGETGGALKIEAQKAEDVKGRSAEEVEKPMEASQ